MTDPIVTAERLRYLFDYDPTTGLFTRLIKLSNRGALGTRVGARCNTAWVIRIDGRRYLAHRLAWLWMTGKWPENEIDHIDGNGINNRWVNLRDVTHLVNQQNRHTAHKQSRLGVLGVVKAGNRYVAHINHHGRSYHLGQFSTAEEAHAAYLEAKRKLHDGCTI